MHLFGSDANLRAGWVTVGPEISASNYNPDQYLGYFKLVLFECLMSLLKVTP